MQNTVKDQIKEKPFFYREVFLNSLDAIAIIDPEGRYLEQNPVHAKMLGYSDLELEKQTPAIHMGEEKFLEVAEALTRTGSYRGELRSRRKDGSMLDLELSAFSVRDSNGELVCYVGIKRDITARKLAEEALHNAHHELERRVEERTYLLKESEERYRALVDLSPDAHTVICDGIIVYMNQTGLRRMGAKSPKDVIGMPVMELVHPFSRDDAIRRIQKLLTDGGRIPEIEFKLQTLEGDFLEAEVAAMAFTFNGQPAIHVIARDITERKLAEIELRRSEEKYRSLVKQSKEGVFVIDPFTRKVLEANPFFVEMMGYTEEELRTMTLYNIVAADRASIDQNIQVTLEKGSIVVTPRHYKRKDGSLLDLEVRASMISIGGSKVILINVSDISERKRASAIQSALYRISEVMSTAEDMEDFYSSIHEIFSELMYARNFYIALHHPESMSLSFPYFVDEVDIPPGTAPLGKGLTEYVLRTGQPLLASPETFRALINQGEVEQVGAPSVDWLGVPLKSGDRTFGVLVVQSYNQSIRFLERDKEVLTFVSRHIASALERKQAAETIRHLAYHDALTGMPNRTLFRDRFQQCLAQAHRKKEMLAMLFMDLDRFKTINDTLGHAIGDRLLQAVAERLKKTIREGDTISRLGGDEFMVLLTGVGNMEGAAKAAEKLLQSLRPAFHIDGHDLHISTSIGISLYPYDGEDAETLLKNADIALYRAKEHGRNNYQLYAPAMNARAFEQLALENQLRRALDRQEFVLHYQPLLDLETRKISGMEALIRWVRPNSTMVMPESFIPLAEDTGLIVPIGEWVLRTACLQNRAWQDRGLPAIPVAVNISARQFQQQDLVQMIAQALKESGLESRYLMLEVTESAIMKRAELSVATMKELKAMGIRISIDDFGTGYSSLSHLKTFPINALKIDQSFVRDCMYDPDDAAIVTAIISMAHSLKLEVIAEGVENEGQLSFLNNLKCDKMQGFFCSRPLTADMFTEMLRHENR